MPHSTLLTAAANPVQGSVEERREGCKEIKTEPFGAAISLFKMVNEQEGQFNEIYSNLRKAI